MKIPKIQLHPETKEPVWIEAKPLINLLKETRAMIINEHGERLQLGDVNRLARDLREVLDLLSPPPHPTHD